MAKRYSIVSRCIAAIALVFIYFVGASAILVGTSTTSAQARGGGGFRGGGFRGGGFRGGGFRGGWGRGRGWGWGPAVGLGLGLGLGYGAYYPYG
jgi:hypothetical protein